MTITLTGLVTAFAMLVGVGLKIYAALNKEKIKNAKIVQLDTLADIAIRSAEEAGNREGDGFNKRQHAIKTLTDLAIALDPKLTPILTVDVVESLIDAGIAGAGLGKTEKKPNRE